MSKNKLKFRLGFTLIELVIAVAASLVVIVAIGSVLAGSQKDWNRMYNRACSDIVTDGYIVRKAFDAVIRKASKEKFLLDDDGSWLEIYYYADDDSAVIDRYARFYETAGELRVEYGKLEPKATLSVQTICTNVSGCVFKATGRSAQMILTLDDGTQTATIVSSAVMNNL